MNDRNRSAGRPGIIDVIRSVGAAFFGVQSEANRQRDFTHGKLVHYVVAGALATVVLVVSIWGLVQLILATAG
ncbi:MAG: DUF2970 domain-containing protein [Halofilum sp. (in: g-proteobacteria)]